MIIVNFQILKIIDIKKPTNYQTKSLIMDNFSYFIIFRIC